MNIHVMTHDELKCVRKRNEVEREIILKIRSLYKNKKCIES